MTLRTISTPLDPLTLTEWRDTVAGWCGVAYANIDSAAQTELNRYIEEAHDYISKRFGHEPWTMQEWSVSLASGTATFTLDAAVRTVMTITESNGTTTRVVQPATKREYLEAWGSGAQTHPWNSQTDPHYLFDGVDNSDPPVQQWKRVPTPDTALTITVLGRPYFGLIASENYTHLPAGVTKELRHHIRAEWAAYKSDYDKAEREMRLAEHYISATQVNDIPEGGVEAARVVDTPDDFYREMGGP